MLAARWQLSGGRPAVRLYQFRERIGRETDERIAAAKLGHTTGQSGVNAGPPGRHRQSPRRNGTTVHPLGYNPAGGVRIRELQQGGLVGGVVPDWVETIEGLSRCLKESAEVSAYLWEKGWAERNAGNLSVDVTDLFEERLESPTDAGWNSAAPDRKLERSYPPLAGRTFLVTGSGQRFRDLARDVPHNSCLLRMTGADAFRIIWGGSPQFRPTSEFPSHLRVHEFLRATNAQEKVVLHTHPTELIAVTHIPEYAGEAQMNRALWGIHPEVAVTIPRGLGLVPYTVPGSEALASATVEALRRGHAAVIWQWHGCVAIARDVLSAFDLIDTANKAAQIILACRAAGVVPKGLDDARLRELRAAFGLPE
jgi:rhamnulose-1-phosphate aldolase